SRRASASSSPVPSWSCTRRSCAGPGSAAAGRSRATSAGSSAGYARTCSISDPSSPSFAFITLLCHTGAAPETRGQLRRGASRPAASGAAGRPRARPRQGATTDRVGGADLPRAPAADGANLDGDGEVEALLEVHLDAPRWIDGGADQHTRQALAE